MLLKALGYKQFITKEGIEKLHNYKYKSSTYTICDNLMTPFWEWVTTWFPMWVAPNLITLAALAISGGVFMQFIFYDSTLSQEFPMHMHLMSAVAIFIYQTLDSVDGKQARRTGSSSPLGQLFDHGCDAVNTTFFGFLLYYSFCYGPDMNLELALFVFFSGASFFSCQVEEAETHVLRTSVGQYGVTELQWTCAGFILVNALSGQWGVTGKFGELPYIGESMPPQIVDLKVNIIILIANCVGGANALLSACWNIVKATKTRPAITALVCFIPLLLWVLAYYMMFASTEWAHQNVAYAIFLGQPLIWLANCRQIVCNVTDMTPDRLPKSFLWFALFPANRYLPELFEIQTGIQNSKGNCLFFEEKQIALFVFVIQLSWFCFFACGTITQICDTLDIYCFKINLKKQDKKIKKK